MGKPPSSTEIPWPPANEQAARVDQIFLAKILEGLTRDQLMQIVKNSLDLLAERSPDDLQVICDSLHKRLSNRANEYIELRLNLPD